MAEQAQVEVLLATYNGERFLRQQIDSILGQDYSAVRILARDDGSSDSTAAILNEYAEHLPDRFRVLVDNQPTGSAKANFLRLMVAAGEGYLCLSDQDDIWLPDKVTRSIEAMLQLEQRYGRILPLLVFSDLRVVDDALTTISPSMWKQSQIDPRAATRLNRLLGASVVTGCTMLINRPLLELARRMPPEATMHDRWISLIAAAMGHVAFLSEPTVLYRQHGGNVIGAATVDTSVAGTITRATQDEGRRSARLHCEVEAEALLNIYAHELPTASADTVRAYLRSGRSESAFERVLTTLRYGFFRSGALRTLALLLDLAKAPTHRR